MKKLYVLPVLFFFAMVFSAEAQILSDSVISSLKLSLRNALEENARLSDKNKDLEARMLSFDSEKASLSREIKEIKRERDNLKRSLKTISSKIIKELRRAKKLLEAIRKENRQLSKELDKADKDNSALVKEIRQYKKTSKTKRVGFNKTLNEEIRLLNSELKTLSDKNNRLLSQISELEKAQERLGEELEKEREGFKREKETLRQELRQEKEALKQEYKKELKGYELDLSGRDKELRKKEKELERISAQRDKYLAKIQNRASKIESKKTVKLDKEKDQLRIEAGKAHYNLAGVLFKDRKFRDSAEEYKRVLVLMPEDSSAYYNLGVIYDDYLLDNKKAIEYYRKYLDLAPYAKDASKVREKVLLAESEERLRIGPPLDSYPPKAQEHR